MLNCCCLSGCLVLVRSARCRCRCLCLKSTYCGILSGKYASLPVSASCSLHPAPCTLHFSSLPAIFFIRIVVAISSTRAAWVGEMVARRKYSTTSLFTQFDSHMYMAGKRHIMPHIICHIVCHICIIWSWSRIRLAVKTLIYNTCNSSYKASYDILISYHAHVEYTSARNKASYSAYIMCHILQSYNKI